MFNIGPAEAVVIFIVALVVLGPNKLPEAARQMGRMAAELRRLSSGFQDEMREAMREPMPTLPPLPEQAQVGPANAMEAHTPEPEGPGPAARRRREPLRADTAVSAEQQLTA